MSSVRRLRSAPVAAGSIPRPRHDDIRIEQRRLTYKILQLIFCLFVLVFCTSTLIENLNKLLEH